MCQMTRRITSAGGELTSPSYPGSYPAHVDCMCTLSADDPSARLVLSLYDLALQTKNGRCRADWLMLREGIHEMPFFVRAFAIPFLCLLATNLLTSLLHPKLWSECD